MKYKNKNGILFLRSFYKLNSLNYNLNFKNKKITKSIFFKKKQKKMEYRILKKLKTFYYIPNIKKTKQRVYSRFKKSVLYKFKRKKYRRISSIYAGPKFNLSSYNLRNRYKNRIRLFKSKKKYTPRYFFFKNKKNNYIDNRYDNIMNIGYKQLPNFIIRKYKLRIKKKNKYYKRQHYKLIKCFGKIKNRTYQQYKQD
jgi:hypothetical protein